MFKILNELPNGRVWVACSGGVDSVFAVDFLRNNPHRNLGIVHFNHGTEWSNDAEAFVRRLADHWGLEIQVGRIQNSRDPNKSPEEHWRDERYAFFDSLAPDTVVTGHNLDDCVETWLWSSCHGVPRTIPHRRNNVVRPFMLARRKDIQEWADRKGLVWINDPSNADVRYMRNYIRHELMPHALKVNPGLHQVVARRVREQAEM